ncbi:MAG: endonuclease/exonuclease/phosphatase family protein [Rubritepida sp.]|nr:endonuclease/exonuclease/phosphatase family protein [Rubritepida sp.]
MRLTRFRVTTFNLLNLNEPGRRMYRDADGIAPALYAQRIAWTGAMLRRAEAEVFGFQELWHPAPLAAALEAAGLAADYVALTPPWLNGQHIACAAAVRRGLLVGEPEWIVKFPPGLRLQTRGEDPLSAAISITLDSFSRPVLHLRIRPHDARPEVHVFVCHFKSKGPTEVSGERWFKADPARYGPHQAAIGAALSTIRRTAEAAALRVLLTEVMKGTGAPVIVLGDLNDEQNSNTLNILTEQPALLGPLSTGGRDTALYSVQSLQEMQSLRDVYYTYIHQGAHGSLDHILVSEEFYASSRNRRWAFDRLDVWNDHLNGEEAATAEGSNDHGVVRAHFRTVAAR